MEERSGSFLPELPYTNRGVIRQKEALSALIDWCQITIKEVPLEAVIEICNWFDYWHCSTSFLCTLLQQNIVHL